VANKAPRDDLPRLGRAEALGAGLCRVTSECCREAAQAVARSSGESAVHRARKALKRAKSLLRLAQDLDVAGSKSTRRRIAVLGRQLAPKRDAAVARKAAAQCAQAATNRGVAEAAGIVVARLTRAPAKIRWAEWRKKVADAAVSVERLPWGEPAPADVVKALCRAARRTTKRAPGAARGGIAEAHEWRKAATVLREQLLVVRSTLACDVDDAVRRLHGLTRRLGRAVDEAVLLAALRHVRWPARLGEARERLERMIGRRQRKQLKRACRHWPKLKKILRHTLAGIGG
jgi:hypothetical protein